MTEPDYCSPFVMGAFSCMLVTMPAAIIAGPNFCHALNLFALFLIILAGIILFRNYRSYSFFKISLFIAGIVLDLILNLYLMYYKYGYFNQHYKNPFFIEA